MLYNRVRYYVGIYQLDMSYGGPEEGGWYYNTGSLVRPLKIFPSRNAAYRYASRANRLLRHLERDKRDISSVIYDGSRHGVEVFEGNLPPYYPTIRPHYE